MPFNSQQRAFFAARNARVRALAAEGLVINEIAKREGMSRDTIERVCREQGIAVCKPPPHNSAPDSFWTPEKVAELRVLWAEGKNTATTIGRKLRCTASSVVGKANRLQLPPRPSPIRRKVTGTNAVPVVVGKAGVQQRGTLPPGHPDTWGAINPGMAWPYA